MTAPDYEAEARRFWLEERRNIGDRDSILLLAQLLERLCGEARKDSELATRQTIDAAFELKRVAEAQLSEARAEVKKLRALNHEAADMLERVIAERESAFERSKEEGRRELRRAYPCPSFSASEAQDECKHCGWIEQAHLENASNESVQRRLKQAREEGAREQREKDAQIIEDTNPPSVASGVGLHTAIKIVLAQAIRGEGGR